MLLSHFSRVRLCDPRNGSPPGSPVPGILQARTLEWVAISFSNAWKWKVKVKSLSRVLLLATPWTAAYQAPPSMGFSRQEYWSGVPLPEETAKTQCQHQVGWLSETRWWAALSINPEREDTGRQTDMGRLMSQADMGGLMHRTDVGGLICRER